MLAFERMPQRMVEVYSITVASPDARTLQDLAFHQVLYYFLGGALGNSNPLSDLPHHHFRIARQAQKDMGVVVQKGPLLAHPLYCRRSVTPHI